MAGYHLVSGRVTSTPLDVPHAYRCPKGLSYYPKTSYFSFKYAIIGT